MGYRLDGRCGHDRHVHRSFRWLEHGGFQRSLTVADGTYSLVEEGVDSGTSYSLTGTGTPSFSVAAAGNYVNGSLSLTETGTSRYERIEQFNNPSAAVDAVLGDLDFLSIGMPLFLGPPPTAPTGGVGYTSSPLPVAEGQGEGASLGVGSQLATVDATTALGIIGIASGHDLSSAANDAVFAEIGTDLQHEYCFPAGTLVRTPDGFKRIEEMQPGDQVHCVSDTDGEGPIEVRPVEQVYHNAPANLLNIHVDGEVIRATHNHPFYVRHRGWVAAAALRSGDELRTFDGGWLAVSETFDNGDTEPVFNLRVAGHHTYFVGISAPGGNKFVLVHNQSPGQLVLAAKPQEKVNSKAGEVNIRPGMIRWTEDAHDAYFLGLFDADKQAELYGKAPSEQRVPYIPSHYIDWDKVADEKAQLSVPAEISGGVKVVGGIGELGMAAGLAGAPEPSSKVVMWILVFHGTDTASTGFQEIISGKHSETLTAKSIRYLAADSLGRNATDNVVMIVETLPGLVGGRMALPSSAPVLVAPKIATAEEAGAARLGLRMGSAPSNVGRGLNVLNPQFVPKAESVLQNLTNQVNRELAANPRLASTVLSRAELDASVNPFIARANYGKAVERLVASKIKADPTLSGIFKHVGGPNSPDFIGQGAFQGMNFDITTPGQVGAHLARPGYGEGLNVITYERPAWVP